MNNQSSELICNDNFNILCRVYAIMRDIIRLKSENRSIGQRMKTLGDKVTKLTLHIARQLRIIKVILESVIHTVI